MLSLRYAEIVYYGLWFTALREALDSFFTKEQERVTGTVGLRLYKGNVTVVRRQSPYSLYRTDLASFSMAHYNPKDAEGFINLFALPVTLPPAQRASKQEPSAQTAAPAEPEPGEPAEAKKR
jgi:argininosuccinate synthase